MGDRVNDFSRNYEPPAKEGPLQQAQSPAEPGDRNAFRKALQRREGDIQEHGEHKGRGDADDGQDDSKKKKNGLPSMTDEIFSSLARAGSPAAEIKSGTLHGDQSEAVERINEMCRQLLVAGEGVSSRGEVLIRLKDSVFPGTEIRLSMEQGQLHVNISTREQAAFGLLSQYSDQLTERLENKLAENCIVNVEMDKGEAREESGRKRHQDSSGKHPQKHDRI